ncbi:MAG: efflux RND transporter periplasmic adaptor subunit, partial [Alphaproteobacteria bacterium]|nr:efflux RND transporter periplasmic adaptor subunit [Alphaproteobacteria bacterium]
IGLVATAAGGIALLHAAPDPDAVDQAATQADALPVRVVAAERQDGHTVSARFAGRLEPARRTALAFDAGGTLSAVLVDEGDAVALGDVVARLDTDRVEAQRRRLRASLASVEAELELARRTLERQQVLEQQGHASTQRLDEARLAVDALDARRAEVAAAVGEVDVALDKAVLRAPFAGTVAARHVDEGAVVGAGRPVLDLLETGRSEARIGVSPDAAATLTVGDTVAVAAGGRRLEARVTALRPDLSTGTRTVTVLLSVATPAATAYGDVVEVTVERPVATSGFWLPMTALVEGERGLWTVYTVRPAPDGGGRVVGQEAVEVRHTEGDRVYVAGTLTDGAVVIADGTHRVIPGQRVRPVEADTPAAPSLDLVEADR